MFVTLVNWGDLMHQSAADPDTVQILLPGNVVPDKFHGQVLVP